MKIGKNEFNNHLVRYRSISKETISAFSEGKLFFSKPKSFNDPFDTLIFADPRRIAVNVSGIIEKSMDSYISEYMIEDAKNNPFGTAPQAIAMWKGNRREELMGRFLERLLEAVEQVKNDIKENQRIICFSEIVDSVLMWSHYADYHRGFCLIFDKDQLETAVDYDSNDIAIRKKHRLEKIHYVNEQIDLSFELCEYIKVHGMNPYGRDMEPAVELSQEKLRKILTQKAKAWEYEAEWRIIPRHIDIENESNMFYTKVDPVAVICGSECEPSDRKVINDICKRRRILYYEMQINPFNPQFSFTIE